MEKIKNNMDIGLLLVTGGLLLGWIFLQNDFLFVGLFLAYLVFHAACFALGRVLNLFWLRFAPGGLIVAGMLPYLLWGAIGAIRGHYLTVIYAIFAFLFVLGAAFSLSLSWVLEKRLPKK